MEALTRVIDPVLDWLAPDRCAACEGTLAARKDLFCAGCAAEVELGLRLRWLDETPAWAISNYAGPTQLAIKRFKFAGHPELARRFARELAVALAGRPCAQELAESVALRANLSSTCLVPVPLHAERLAERGYNQAGLLAKALAGLTHCNVELRALTRVKNAGQQSRLDRARRLTNLEGSIAVRHLPSTRVVLVDDVLTTGATLRQCAKVLRHAGVEVSAMLTLAHTD